MTASRCQMNQFLIKIDLNKNMKKAKRHLKILKLSKENICLKPQE